MAEIKLSELNKRAVKALHNNAKLTTAPSDSLIYLDRTGGYQLGAPATNENEGGDYVDSATFNFDSTFVDGGFTIIYYKASAEPTFNIPASYYHSSKGTFVADAENRILVYVKNKVIYTLFSSDAITDPDVNDQYATSESGIFDWDAGTYPNRKVTITGDLTIRSITGLKPGKAANLILVQNGTGGHAVYLPTAMYSTDSPSLDTTANMYHRLHIFNTGSVLEIDIFDNRKLVTQALLPIDLYGTDIHTGIATELIKTGVSATALYRIVRSGDDAESTFTYAQLIDETASGAAYWVTEGGSTPAANGVCTEILDQAGTAHFTQAAAAAAPFLFKSGTLCVDSTGYPCLKFEGAQIMTCATSAITGAHNVAFDVSYFVRYELEALSSVFSDSVNSICGAGIFKENHDWMIAAIYANNNTADMHISRQLSGALNSINVVSMRLSYNGSDLATNTQIANGQSVINVSQISYPSQIKGNNGHIDIGAAVGGSGASFMQGNISLFMAYTRNVLNDDLNINAKIAEIFN